MEKVNKKLGYSATFEDEPKQRQVEKFFIALRREEPQWRNLPITEVSGAYARAAQTSELLLDPSDPVGEMEPRFVLWLGEEVDNYIVEIMSVPEA